MDLLEEQKGSVTVFLTLTFALLLGFALCMVGGMHDCGQKTLNSDAVEGAGEYVTANYDKELYRRYHLFFMDPREKADILADAKKYMDAYFDQSSFYQLTCDSLSISGEQYATDKNGRYVKSEIREWMKYQTVKEAGSTLKALCKAISKEESTSEKNKSRVKGISNAADENKEDKEGKQESKDKQEGTKEVTTQEQQNRIQWKEIRDTVSTILQSGILLYVAKDKGVSPLQVSGGNLPSQSSGKAEKMEQTPELDMTNVHKIANLLGCSDKVDEESPYLADEYFILQYISEYFGNYCDPIEDEKSALNYEVEYLVGGQLSDRKNLQYVVNRLILLRFAMNFASAMGNDVIDAEAEALSAGLSAILFLPQAQKAVKCILIAVLSYGETLIETRALLSGKKISLYKSEATWNADFVLLVPKLLAGANIKQGKINVGYEDYLMTLLLMKRTEKKLYSRMMDVMQMNVALVEPGFLMEDCLFSFELSGEIVSKSWFSSIPVYHKSRSDHINQVFRRVFCY